MFYCIVTIYVRNQRSSLVTIAAVKWYFCFSRGAKAARKASFIPATETTISSYRPWTVPVIVSMDGISSTETTQPVEQPIWGRLVGDFIFHEYHWIYRITLHLIGYVIKKVTMKSKKE